MGNQKKQTAMQKLINALKQPPHKDINIFELAKWIEQNGFLEIEKQQITDAFVEGIGSGKYQQEYGENAKGSMLPQQYIKETYGIYNKK